MRYLWAVSSVVALVAILSSPAAACPPLEKCSELWVAAHDFNASNAFFTKDGKPAAAFEIGVGDQLKAETDILVREQPAKWPKTQFIFTLKTGELVWVDAVADLTSSTTPGKQRWIQIRTAANIPAKVPVPPPSSTGPKGWSDNVVVKREGVWWEQPVAEATGGYDAQNNRTLINAYDSVVYGPSSVEKAAVEITESCVTGAAKLGYEAFNKTPGELSAKVAAAWTAFHGAVDTCLTAQSVAKELAHKFELGYVRRGRWVPGLNLTFSAENPAAQQFRQMHNWVKDKVPDPVNKLITFYIGTQDLPKVDITLDPPRFMREAIPQLPDVPELRNMVDRVEKEALKDPGKFAGMIGQKKDVVLSELKDEAKNLGKRLGSEALQAQGGKLLQEGVRVVGDAADDIAKRAPRFVAENLVPHVENGQVVVGPVQWSSVGMGTGGGGGPQVCVTPAGTFPGPCPNVPQLPQLPQLPNAPSLPSLPSIPKPF